MPNDTDRQPRGRHRETPRPCSGLQRSHGATRPRHDIQSLLSWLETKIVNKTCLNSECKQEGEAENLEYLHLFKQALWFSSCC